MSDEPWLPQESGAETVAPSASKEEPSRVAPMDVFLDTWILWPYVGYVFLLSWLFSWFMPLPAAIPLALVASVFLYLFSGIVNGGKTLLEIAIGATIGLIPLAAIVFSVSSARHAVVGRTCLTNLKRVGQAIALYSADYDDHLPPADRWADATAPYLSKPEKKAPVVPGMPNCAPNYAEANYAFDSRLSSKSLPNVWLQQETITVYDSTARSRNAHDAGISLPRPGRHPGGNNVLFLDGHAALQKEGALSAVER